MAKKPKRYTIKTIEDVFNCVTEENAAYFITDFTLLIGQYLEIKRAIKQNKIPKKDYKFDSFIWIDDKKHEGKVVINELKPNKQ